MRVMLFAHAGHTLTTIAYFLPVVAFLAWLLITQIRDRRDRSRTGS
jgi:cbb3-type cytochrome oxidase subunit 3